MTIQTLFRGYLSDISHNSIAGQKDDAETAVETIQDQNIHHENEAKKVWNYLKLKDYNEFPESTSLRKEAMELFDLSKTSTHEKSTQKMFLKRIEKHKAIIKEALEQVTTRALME